MIKLAGIWNINSVYNANSKQISTKLSFQIGEKFSARVLNLNKLTGEILLKLLDGWQFSAEIDNPESILENKLIRLQVEGFENDKLKLKVVKSEESQQNESKDSIKLFIKENSLNLNSEDYEIIEKMVKSEIPLTKENISNIKTILDFINKIKQYPKEEDVFIQNYLLSKSINPDSQKGDAIKDTLKNFFNELKNIDKEDLFIFLENNVELNEDNIKSFNNVFKKDSTIYNEIKYLGDILKSDKSIYNNEENNDNVKQSNSYKNGEDNSIGNKVNTLKADEKINYSNQPKLDVNTKSSVIENNTESDKLNKILDEVKNVNTEEKLQVNNRNKLDINENVDSKQTYENNNKSVLSNTLDFDGKMKEMSSHSARNANIIAENIDEIVSQIKDQVNAKTDEIKDIIRQFLEQKSDGKNEFSKNIIYQLNNNINDFKLFNTISNSYYYMDLPINLNDTDYQCKLMIKDDRKKGKKIDSTNVKIITSISTENMGVVDAYLTVNNSKMNIDIKCSKEWLNLLSQGHKRILESLSNMKYNIDVAFYEKKEEMNISTCREFFDDNDIGTLNIRV
ncbi:hypothetical protein ACJDU8_19230 [Clostridium sp. WILCCON 0269]|uniref:Flagellar hook-length control protein-like C-terminal domain-containing protein n=1 Tax=Candidatus Clostridium eludens TaxID=3381663 RepID=A0ABW8SPH0_9CLOT